MRGRRVGVLVSVACAALGGAHGVGCSNVLGFNEPSTSTGGLGQPCDDGNHHQGQLSQSQLVTCQTGLACVNKVCVSSDGGSGR